MQSLQGLGCLVDACIRPVLGGVSADASEPPGRWVARLNGHGDYRRFAMPDCKEACRCVRMVRFEWQRPDPNPGHRDGTGMASGAESLFGLTRRLCICRIVGPSRPQHVVGYFLVAVLAKFQYLLKQRLKRMAAM